MALQLFFCGLNPFHRRHHHCLSFWNKLQSVWWIKILVGSELTFYFAQDYKTNFHYKTAMVQEGSGALEQTVRSLTINLRASPQYSPLSQLSFSVMYIDLKEVSILPVSKLNGSISLGFVEIKVPYSFGIIRSLHTNKPRNIFLARIIMIFG